ncbi:hypothetical protein Phi19:1_gp073 [Cellulophaga phage phi19:1]|uniref:Uncharacterized protein n=1 Tax=Cellulophaga phage phi19:1 TaxID=1327970 RepID=R9ZZH9_9CAUD|nr:hypothetical protein Phi19:1_gp073 [Cellulophaga phage phi19:1]AGO47363.1 hypothetical protein Phi19:1_gp073 [Cellulophaga phage phi19:1]
MEELIKELRVNIERAYLGTYPNLIDALCSLEKLEKAINSQSNKIKSSDLIMPKQK